MNYFFLSLFFYQSTVLSSRTVDGHQMYFVGSVVGKASSVGKEISPDPPLIFTGVKKCEIWRRLKHHSTLGRPRLKTQQDIRNLKQNCNAGMIALSLPRLVKLGLRTPEKSLLVLSHHIKLHAKMC